MGDAGLVALPSTAGDSTPYIQSKPRAQLVEDKKRDVSKHLCPEEPKEKPRNSWESICPKRTDTPIHAPPHPSTSSGSQESDTQAGARPSSESTTSRTPVPTPIRSLKPIRLWIDDGPEAGKAMSEWKEKNVANLHEWTKDMTIEDRTQKFDALVAQDQDTHLQSVAMYYTFHPEHLPDRDLSRGRQKALENAMAELTPYQLSQQREVFRRWLVPGSEGKGEFSWNDQPPKEQVEERVGPKDEIAPDEVPPECKCKHCTHIPRREKLRSVLSTPVAAIRWRRKASTTAKQKPPPQSTTTLPPSRETTRTSAGMYDSAISDCSSSGKLKSGDVSSDDLVSTSMGSAESRSRDLTETGVGILKPKALPKLMRKKTRTSSTLFRTSTAHVS